MDDDISLKIQIFDSASRNFKKSESIKIDDSYFCIDNKNEIIQLNNQSDIDDNFFLFHLGFNENFNSIVVDNLLFGNHTYQNEKLINELDDKLWFFTKTKLKREEKRYYYLTQGDIIKLGNLKFLVNEINIDNIYENKKENEQKEENKREKKKEPKYISPVLTRKNFIIKADPIITNIITKAKECKFCSSYYFEICECKKLYHFSCFRELNKNKLVIENNIKNSVKKYFIKDFFCKNCNCQFSFCYDYYIQNQNEIIPLKSFDFEYPEGSYIILESLGTRDKTVYAIDLNKGGIRIGKDENKENDIIIKDNSIKEEHAMIKCDKENGNVWIESLCNDEFNLSILVRYEIELKEQKLQKFVFNTGKYIFRLDIGTNSDSDYSNDEEDNEEK